MPCKAALLQAMQMTEQRTHRNQERKIPEGQHLIAMIKTTIMRISTQHGCKCHTKYEDEIEISSAAKRETALGEFQRKIKRTMFAMLS